MALRAWLNKKTEPFRTWLADGLEAFGRKIGIVDTDMYIQPSSIVTLLSINNIKELHHNIERLVRVAPTSFFRVYYNEEYFDLINHHNQELIKKYVSERINTD